MKNSPKGRAWQRPHPLLDTMLDLLFMPISCLFGNHAEKELAPLFGHRVFYCLKCFTRRTEAMLCVLCVLCGEAAFAQEAAPIESSSAVRFVCYADAGCPPAGSSRAQEAQQAAAAPKLRPWYRSWEFWAARAISAGFAVWDGETTLRCLQRNPLCEEANPWLGTHPSRRRVYAVGAITLAGETAVLAAVWRKNPEAGRGLSWTVAGARAGLHTWNARQNIENAKVTP